MNKQQEQAYHRIEAAKFANNNGTILRGVINCLSNRFFVYRELEAVLAPYNLSDDEIYDGLDYLTDKSYITVREKSNKLPVALVDFSLDELEFKLSANGKLVAKSIIADNGVEI